MRDRLIRFSPWLLVAWTVFLWLSRLRNVLADDDLTTTGRIVRVLVVAAFVSLAAFATVGMLRKQVLPLVVLTIWTIGYWLVRGTGILIGDWSISFKVVHTALMITSLGLAALVLRSGRLRSSVDAQAPVPQR